MIRNESNLHDRIDPELADALAAVPKSNGRIFDLGELEGTRALIRQMAAQAEPAAAANTAVLVEAHEASRSGEPPVPLRMFRPTSVRGALPAMLWFHGGGQVLGFAAQEDAYLKRIAGEVGCMVISVDYRLAPEARAPAAAQDGLAAWRWLCREAKVLGADPTRLAIAGASGGGGVAAATALMIRDEGAPTPLFQSLNYPMIDDRNETPSAREISGLGVWDRENNVAAWQLILGDAAGGPDVSPYAAPARAATVDRLPPTCIIVGELDVFRDEDVTYATRLLQSGVATELHVFPGAYHAWDLFAPDAGLTTAFFQTWFGYLRRAFRR